MLPSERRDFVRSHRTCVFGYGRHQDGPAMSVVYYEVAQRLGYANSGITLEVYADTTRGGGRRLAQVVEAAALRE